MCWCSQGRLENMARQGEQALQAALTKAQAAEVALAGMIGPSKGLSFMEAEEAQAKIEQLEKELAAKAGALEAAESSLQTASKQLQECTQALQVLLATPEAVASDLPSQLAHNVTAAGSGERGAMEDSIPAGTPQPDDAAQRADIEKQLQEAKDGLKEARRKLESSSVVVEELRKRLRTKDEALQELERLRAKAAELHPLSGKKQPPVVQKGACGC